jgi:hypothetical protein
MPEPKNEPGRKSVFIGVVHEESNRILSIQNWAREGRIGPVDITHETEDRRIIKKEKIKKLVSDKIREAGIVIVLIGNNLHHHNWIDAEVELANSFRKKIVCLRVPNTTGAAPPVLQKYEMIDFNPDSLKKAIEKG